MSAQYKLANSIIFGIVTLMLGFIFGMWMASLSNPEVETVVIEREVYIEERAIPELVIEEVPVLESETDLLYTSKPIEEVEIIEPQEITRDFNVFQPCGYDAEDLTRALSTESHQGLLPYVNTFLEAEETYGVNAFYLICKLGYESGWGKYMADRNNIGGWTDGNGGFQSFESVEECILHIAENLSTVYRDAVGDRLEDVSEMYCPDNGYVNTLLQIMRERESVINGEEF